MLKNYFTIALRMLHRDRLYAALNLVGLIVGITSFMVLALFVRNELTYDRFHEEPDNVYRLTTYTSSQGREARFALVNGYVDHLIQENIPEVEAATTLFRVQRELVLRNGTTAFTESNGFYTDAEFSQVFTFDLQAGDPDAVLDAPNAIVLTDALARKYFGEADPLGQTLEWVAGPDDESMLLEVTGVLAPLPENSHLHFDFLIAGAVMGDHWEDFFFAPSADPMVYVYFRTNRTLPIRALQEKVDAATEAWKAARAGEAYRSGAYVWRFPVQRLTDIYFNAHNAFEHTAGGNRAYVQIMAVVAVLILLMAIINYVNLSTARSARRAREVGVRKVLGSTRARLISQFLLESVLMSLLATAIAVVLAEGILRNLLPALLGVHLSLFEQPMVLGAAAVIGGVVGVVAGLVPAFTMTRFRVVNVLKGTMMQGRRRALSLRSVLVTVQFTVTIGLLISAAVILRQSDYLEDRGLGYPQDHLVAVSHSDSESSANWEAFLEAIRQVPGVQRTGSSTYHPVGDQNSTLVSTVDAETSEPVRVAWNLVSYDFIPTLGLEFVEGRNFSRDFPSDAQAVIINEAARRALGLDSAVGAKIQSWFTEDGGAPIIGVVQDYHFQSFNLQVAPLVLRLNPQPEDILIARLEGTNVRQTLAQMDRLWQRVGMIAPFEVAFVDDSFEQLIRKERRLGRIMNAFTLVSIVIACLGLFGLAAYSAEQRTKEVGIRKVLGASVPGLVALLSREFLTLVAVAFVLAVPVAHLAMQKWLEDFAYRIELGWGVYMLAGGLALVIALATVSTQAIRAALADPVRSLRYE